MEPKFKIGNRIAVFVNEPTMRAIFTVTEIRKTKQGYEYGWLHKEIKGVSGTKWTVTEDDIVNYGKVLN
jgi:hypothetical protein